MRELPFLSCTRETKLSSPMYICTASFLISIDFQNEHCRIHYSAAAELLDRYLSWHRAGHSRLNTAIIGIIPRAHINQHSYLHRRRPLTWLSQRASAAQPPPSRPMLRPQNPTKPTRLATYFARYSYRLTRSLLDTRVAPN